VNSLAIRLNETLKGSVVYDLLSPVGRNLYFPHGIVSQSQQASASNCSYNATAGVALEDGKYITHPLFSKFSPTIDSDEMVGYAPTSGLMELRKRWDEHIIDVNHLLKGVKHSLPIVTSGITHALSLVSTLFIDEDTNVLVPSPCWDNYSLLFKETKGARIHHYPMFDEDNSFSVEHWKVLFHSIESDKIVVVFNFPHNPTGFTPTQQHMVEIAQLLESLAMKGKKIAVIIDDAYFGLFHNEECSPYSLFSYLAHAHNNIVAIKCDGATKESLVWGFRVGFVTYGGKGLSEKHLEALIEKTKGAIRSSVSSAPMISQSLLLKVMGDSSYTNRINEVQLLMKRRYKRVLECVATYNKGAQFTLLPANSGYFISFNFTGDAYELRNSLLSRGFGIIALNEHLIRIAYSSVDDDKIEYLMRAIFEGVSYNGN
jgi:aspartate/methionine/tyrosine aminotransferase